MKHYLYSILFFFISGTAVSQNLVPNPGFELYDVCPTSNSQLDGYVSSWMNVATGSGGTPDFLNECSTSVSGGVPLNFVGNQYAHNGLGMSGVVIARNNSNVNFREYIEAPLISTLIAGTCYQFEMFISLADNSQYNSDDISVYFSNTAITGINNFNPLPFLPQIDNPTGNFPDTSSWTSVTGTYTATGNENYIIIGNFKDATNSTTVLFNNNNMNYAYTYIDDVSLIPCAASGINKNNNLLAMPAYPNPANDHFTVSLKNNIPAEITLYDITSRKLLQQSFINSVTLDISAFAKGTYIYEVMNDDGVSVKGKIVKE